MSNYIPFNKIVANIPITNGDIAYVSSDILELSKICRAHGEKFDREAFIIALQHAVGKEGTLLLPVFNWDFCMGIPFDYYKTPGKTGALGNAALRMTGFSRTKHPIYSFAIWGRDAEMLAAMDNISAFGADSPFAYMHKNGAINYLIGVDVPQSFTFTHYVEEQCRAPYRYLKDFTADYTDADNKTALRTYSMYVRKRELNVALHFEPIQREFLETGAAKKFVVNGVDCMRIDLCHAFEQIQKDIMENKGRKVTCFDGQ